MKPGCSSIKLRMIMMLGAILLPAPQSLSQDDPFDTQLKYLRTQDVALVGRDSLVEAYDKLISSHREDPRVAEAMLEVAALFTSVERPELDIYPDPGKALVWLMKAAATAVEGSPTWIKAQFSISGHVRRANPQEARKILDNIAAKAKDKSSLLLARIELEYQTICIEEGDLDAAEYHCRRLLGWYADPERIPNIELEKAEIDYLMISAGASMMAQFPHAPWPVKKRVDRIVKLMKDYGASGALYRNGQAALKSIREDVDNGITYIQASEPQAKSDVQSSNSENGTSEPPGIGRKWRPESKEWEKPMPRVWIRQYLGVEFPNSARHFVLYYRSGDEDVALFSFDIAKDDLQHLMDGRSVFPGYGDLVSGSTDLPERIVCDLGSQYFAQEIAAIQNALSASKSRTTAAQPLTVQFWIAEASAVRRTVYVCVISDQHADRAIAYGGFKTPAAPVETKSYVIMDSRYEQMADTKVWQRWSLDETAYRQLMQTIKARNDILRYSGDAAERRIRGFTRFGPGSGAPWWKPSDLKQARPRDSEPLEYFSDKGPGVTSWLIIGRRDGLFHCYVRTERHVLASDPFERIWRLLGLDLPDSAGDVHYDKSVPNPAGIVYWMRFDLPQRDFEACLARTPKLPAYTKFIENAAVKEHLHIAYQTGAPQWWRPQELREGIYAQRTSNTKELDDISLGIGRLEGEKIRVYIGAFSPW